MDVHNYAYIARKAFHGFIHRLAPVVFENAFVVQGACVVVVCLGVCGWGNARTPPPGLLSLLGPRAGL